MHICVASTNRAKSDAVALALEQMSITAHIDPQYAESGVSEQPFSIAETRTGAINRAQQAVTGCDAAIGLEGGVFELEGKLYLCNWGALVTAEGKVYTAAGAQVPLPEEIEQQLRAGKELGPVMDAYAQETGIRHHKGAIGILTAGKLNRVEMFAQIVVLLFGQWQANSD
ncbi:DUF84 family protein [Planococcus sp. ISL-109]|uniref:DUF84 family protein n=1 Tax=Planococcus sp. ISL-109 TaxID=2819166 RepID=UPI001BEC834A|nr:DUF84 family protein [Planococcus sp. ISL-109]MBT2582555.1 DUF84 family protein [Planococcus sp. ISL-109]